MTTEDILILGGGMTGLAAGIASGAEVYEASDRPGGLCASYYVAPDSGRRLARAPSDGNAYRFEIGGGHWVWGCDPLIERTISSLVTLKSYSRSAGVYLADSGQRTAFPIQHNLKALGGSLAAKALQEIVESAIRPTASDTMKDCLHTKFGPTLCDLFFDPFQRAYTAGLWDRIGPEDSSKSPVDLSQIINGAIGHTSPAGYNARFMYPMEGLDVLAERMAQQCRVTFSKRVERIDLRKRTVWCNDQSSRKYRILLSTLPLIRVLEMSGLSVNADPDPYVSVLVLNVGGVKGPHFPKEHWLYTTGTRGGFHRVGFYSNIEASFLPKTVRNSERTASIYVEKAYIGGTTLSSLEIADTAAAIVGELRGWGWLATADVVDPTWIEVAYTWRLPGSRWVDLAVAALQGHGIYPIGRYGQWATGLLQQGLAQSLRAGFETGALMKVAPCQRS